MTENPAKTVKLFRKKRKRRRILSKEEISHLLAHLPEHQRAIIKFALLTGLRKSNLLNLKWSHVDLPHKRYHLPGQETKGGDDLESTLSNLAINLLKGIHRHPESEFVFCKADGKPYKDIYHGFKGALKRAGIKDCTIHTLRHTFGSHLVMSGVDLPTVKEFMGHKDIQTTMQYVHLFPCQRDAISKIEKLFTNDTYSDTTIDNKEKGLRLCDRNPLILLVPKGGLEPRQAVRPLDPEPSASTSSATSAMGPQEKKDSLLAFSNQ